MALQVDLAQSTGDDAGILLIVCLQHSFVRGSAHRDHFTHGEVKAQLVELADYTQLLGNDPGA
ncbi:hypothetical protein D3C75_705880 [compost metagenome]